MLRVGILDDHPAVVAGLRRLIEPEPDLTVLATAGTAGELARRLDGRRPDVLVLDHDISRTGGLTHCRRIKSRPNPPRVVIYSAYTGAGSVLAARAAQADAVVDKADPVPALLAAIRTVGGGGTVLPDVPRDAHRAAVERLDDADLPIFAMLLDREPIAVIAQVLGEEPARIERRAQRIVDRLRPRDRIGA